MGFRPVHTLARGYYLHIDDLVVDEAFRGAGTGKNCWNLRLVNQKSGI